MLHLSDSCASLCCLWSYFTNLSLWISDRDTKVILVSLSPHFSQYLLLPVRNGHIVVLYLCSWEDQIEDELIGSHHKTVNWYVKLSVFKFHAFHTGISMFRNRLRLFSLYTTKDRPVNFSRHNPHISRLWPFGIQHVKPVNSFPPSIRPFLIHSFLPSSFPSFLLCFFSQI